VISGTVTDADNRPLPGVTVTVASADDSLRRSIVTNANGRYEIVNLLARIRSQPNYRASVLP